MKHRNRICALALAGVMSLSLAACGGTAGSDATPAPISTLPPDFTPDLDVEDLWLACADIDSDFELFTADGVPITARTYLYWLAGTIYSTYDGDPDWTIMEDGVALADQLKADVQDAIVMRALLVSKAKELGMDMTQEQTDELDSYMSMMILMSGGEDVVNESMRQAGLDYDTLYELYSQYYYYTQLSEGLFTDEDVSAYIDDNLLYAKHILLLTVDPTTYVPLDEETIAEKKATAEDLLAQLQSSDDLLTDFDALMNEYSEDSGLAANPDGYMFMDGQMVTEFTEGTRALEYGKISDLVESDYGYHIILRLDPASNETLLEQTRTSDSILELARGNMLDEQLETWVSEAKLVFSDEYNSLDVPLFYAKYQAYQQAFIEAEEAAEAEANESTPPSEEGDGSTPVEPEPETDTDGASPSEAGDEPAEDQN